MTYGRLLRDAWLQAVVLFGLLSAFGPRLQAQVPDLVRYVDEQLGQLTDPVPQLATLLDGNPLTTNIEDADWAFPILDNYDPGRTTSLGGARRSVTGGFLLPPGSYEAELHSYCLKAGTYAPGRGAGYLYAPLRGPQAHLIRSILQNSAGHPEIPRGQIQTLLWAVLSRTDFRSLPPDLYLVAGQLLSPREILLLSSSSLGLIPGNVLRAALGHLPAEVRRPLEAEAQIRELLRGGSSAYAELERIAVLAGTPPWGANSAKVPAGRWSYHPEGYFVRYFPKNVERTRVQVLVPSPYRVERDLLDRIVAVEDRAGNRIEVNYDEEQRPPASASVPGLRAYAFSSIRFYRPAHPGAEPHRAEWHNTGWTWHGWADHTANRSTSSDPKFTDLRQRFDEAQARCRDFERFFESAGPHSGTSPRVPLGVLNLAHFADAVKQAVEDIRLNGPAGIEESQTLATEALAFETCRHLGGCDSPAAGNAADVEFDPSGHIAVPGNTHRQRLGLSARLY